MVRAIIFDCFGVLTTEGWMRFKAQYFGEDPKRFEAAGDLSQRANSGLMSFDDFIKEISSLAGVELSITLKALRQNVPNEPLFELIRNELKPKYKIGFLSNVAIDHMRQMFSPQQIDLFDAVTLSYQVGSIKPDAQAYEIAAQQLGVKPAESVLVDDKQQNVTGAHNAGMKAILYKDFEQFKADLDSILANSKS